jgi:hypothetical protein
MDSTGTFHASTPEARAEIERMLVKESGEPETVGDTATMPKDSIELSDDALHQLTRMNRHCRRIFFSARRAGLSESQALDRARAGLPR